MREMHPGVVTGPTQIILSPHYEENALGGVLKGPTPIILSPYHEENALEW